MTNTIVVSFEGRYLAKRATQEKIAQAILAEAVEKMRAAGVEDRIIEDVLYDAFSAFEGREWNQDDD